LRILQVLKKVCNQTNGLDGDWEKNEQATHRILKKYLAQRGRMPIV
jgi:hypothetical protein